jgi:hypothetical protein
MIKDQDQLMAKLETAKSLSLWFSTIVISQAWLLTLVIPAMKKARIKKIIV